MVNTRLIGERPFSYARGVVNSGMVNGCGFEFLRAVKSVFFRHSAYKNAILLLRGLTIKPNLGLLIDGSATHRVLRRFRPYSGFYCVLSMRYLAMATA